MPLDPNLLEAVRQTLNAIEGEGDASLPAVARVLSLSPRTLQRHLRAMGTTLRREYDFVRMMKAEVLLADAQYSLMEVAFRLGFAEQSTFHRAFRRWCGMSPLSFRQLAMARLVKELSPSANADDRHVSSVLV